MVESVSIREHTSPVIVIKLRKSPSSIKPNTSDKMVATKIPDFDNPGDQVMKPSHLAHVVLRTNNFHGQRDFYLAFLGAHVVFENDMLCFMTYDDEHHRIAIVNIEGTAQKNQQTCGLEHIAFTFDTLSDLMLAYRQRLQHTIKPFWCVNHGPTTSMYYKDADGNVLETQVDNLSADEATEFMYSPDFRENPIGVDFDPEELIEKIRKGIPDAELKKRPVIGHRDLPVNMIDEGTGVQQD